MHKKNYAFEEDGKWGYCYQDTFFVIPQYEETAALGNNTCCFMAKKDGKWGLIDAMNRILVPFEYDDINLKSWNNEKDSIVLQPISAYGKGILLPREVYHTNPYHSLLYSNEFNEPHLIPVKKGDKWGYIDFNGHIIIDFIFDQAFLFRNCSTKKKNIWLANVVSEGLWGNVDIEGNVIVPCQYEALLKVKQLKKFIKKNKRDYRYKVQQLSVLLPTQPTKLNRYTHTYKGKVNIVKKATNKKKGIYHYNISTDNNNPTTTMEFDKILTREGDVYRVVKNGKMGVVDLNRGLIYPCIYDEISSFDSYGFAKATANGTQKQISLNLTCTNYLPDLNSILHEAEALSGHTDYFEKAEPLYNQLVVILRDIDNPSIRHLYNYSIMQFYAAKNRMDDPELRARIETEEQKKKSAFWSILGGAVEIAGNVTQAVSIAQTGESNISGDALATLGQAMAGKEITLETDTEKTSYQENEISTAEDDVITLQNRITSIDKRIQTIGEEQAELLQNQFRNKAPKRASAANAVKAQTGSDLIRNNSSNRTQNRTRMRAAAQTKYNNKGSSFDTQIKRLNEEKAQLLSERKQLSNQIAALQGRNVDNDNSKQTSTAETEKDNVQNYSFIKKNYYNYKSQINAIDRELSDRKADPEKYYNSGETVSEFRQNVRDLQQKAKALIEKYRIESGGDILRGTPSLYEWNP